MKTSVKINQFDYLLPDEKIAQYPLAERDRSKLLLYRNKMISEDTFINIDQYLPKGTFLVFNNSKVIRARLLFRKESGAAIEIFCLEPLNPPDYSQNLSSTEAVEWKCLIGNVKKWKSEKISLEIKSGLHEFCLTAEKVNQRGDTWTVRFTWNSKDFSFGEIIELAGHIPLPPYINRPDETKDSRTYQTVYSKIKGSVAAPTAGLHFTGDLLKKLIAKDIRSTEITLHVGAGTFQPVKTQDIRDHIMHSEHIYVSKDTIEKLLMNSGKIIATGTTSVRTLESLYWLGLKIMAEPEICMEDLFLDQWEPYSMDGSIRAEDTIESILLWMQREKLSYVHCPTRIIIIPGYDFKIINGMITNFHQPRSTLLLLISAWVGDDWKKIYAYALENDFRFLSYGDSSLLLR